MTAPGLGPGRRAAASAGPVDSKLDTVTAAAAA